MEKINVIGGGFSGLTIGYLLGMEGYDVHLYEKEKELGGHSRSIEVQGVICDSHGPHYFHCNEQWLWDWIQTFTEFRWYVPTAKVVTKNGVFNWPMTMEVIETHPDKYKIREELANLEEPDMTNFESYCRSVFGDTLYEDFIKNYTRKVWGTTDLDISFAPKRIPFREDNNSNYFTDKYQGVPRLGYNKIFEGLADRLTVHQLKATKDNIPKGKTFVCIAPDDFMGATLGELEYRSIKFEFLISKLPVGDPQVNVALDNDIIRITEPRAWTGQESDKSVEVVEKPGGRGKFYPMATPEARATHKMYKDVLESEGYTLAGRLGNFKYMNMDETIKEAFEIVAKFVDKPVDYLIDKALADRNL